MLTHEVRSKMWTDLLLAETDARSAVHLVTRRAQIYMESGLPLEDVLDALKVSRATWYRRVEALQEWAAAAAAATQKAFSGRSDHQVTDLAGAEG
jgi:hypothetical protein